MLPGDVGKAAGDIGAAREDDTLDLGADGGQRCPGPVAAIEQHREARTGSGLARCCDERREPAGPSVNAGVGGAGEDHRSTHAHRGFERADRVGERVDDDDGVPEKSPTARALCP